MECGRRFEVGVYNGADRKIHCTARAILRKYLDNTTYLTE
jgi:hypothetical protein